MNCVTDLLRWACQLARAIVNMIIYWWDWLIRIPNPFQYLSFEISGIESYNFNIKDIRCLNDAFSGLSRKSHEPCQCDTPEKLIEGPDQSEDSINLLPAKLRKNGFLYTLVQRGRRSCIYRQDVSPGISNYEVFQLKIRPLWKIKGKVIPAREVFPSDGDFGIWAWSHRSREKAMQKYVELEGAESQMTAKNTASGKEESAQKGMLKMTCLKEIRNYTCKALMPLTDITCLNAGWANRNYSRVITPIGSGLKGLLQVLKALKSKLWTRDKLIPLSKPIPTHLQAALQRLNTVFLDFSNPNINNVLRDLALIGLIPYELDYQGEVCFRESSLKKKAETDSVNDVFTQGIPEKGRDKAVSWYKWPMKWMRAGLVWITLCFLAMLLMSAHGSSAETRIITESEITWPTMDLSQESAQQLCAGQQYHIIQQKKPENILPGRSPPPYTGLTPVGLMQWCPVFIKKAQIDHYQ